MYRSLVDAQAHSTAPTENQGPTQAPGEKTVSLKEFLKDVKIKPWPKRKKKASNELHN